MFFAIRKILELHNINIGMFFAIARNIPVVVYARSIPMQNMELHNILYAIYMPNNCTKNIFHKLASNDISYCTILLITIRIAQKVIKFFAVL